MVDLTTDDAIEQKPDAIYLQDYQAPDYQVEQLQLEFKLDANTTQVSNRMRLLRNEGVLKTVPLVLDGNHLELKVIELDGRTLEESEYECSDEKLIINQVPDNFELHVVTIISPEKNTALEGLYASGGMLCTQCEAEGFRLEPRLPVYPSHLNAAGFIDASLRPRVDQLQMELAAR